MPTVSKRGQKNEPSEETGGQKMGCGSEPGGSTAPLPPLEGGQSLQILHDPDEFRLHLHAFTAPAPRPAHPVPGLRPGEGMLAAHA